MSYIVTCVWIRVKYTFTVVLYHGHGSSYIHNEFRFMPRPSPATIQEMRQRYSFLEQNAFNLRSDATRFKAIAPALHRDGKHAFAETFWSQANKWEKESEVLVEEYRALNRIRFYTNFFAD